MASFCRSAMMAGSRSISSRSKTVTQSAFNMKSSSTPPLFSLPKPASRASRVVSAMGSVESMMPLHTAIASARLKSSLAANSSCWSWLSQGFATPL